MADVMPISVGVRMMKEASMGVYSEHIVRDFVILVVITLVCSAVAIKTFRWE